MKKYYFLLLVSLFVLSGCGGEKKTIITETATPAVVTNSLPIALVIAPADFNQEVLLKVEEQLAQKKLSYEFISIQTGKFVGNNGREVEVKKTSWEIKPEDYRAVIFIGGGGMAAIAQDNTLINLAQKFAKAGKKLVAFGEGNEVLREAGVLTNGGQDSASTTNSENLENSGDIEQIISSLSE